MNLPEPETRCSFVRIEDLLTSDFRLFEEDFLDLTDQQRVDRYARALIELDGCYVRNTRQNVRTLVMGDNIEVSGAAGVVGGRAHQVQDVAVSQLRHESGGAIDLKQLALELEQLRMRLKEKAHNADDDIVVADVARAQQATSVGDQVAASRHLRAAGRRALDVAQGLGIGLAVAAIRSATGMD